MISSKTSTKNNHKLINITINSNCLIVCVLCVYVNNIYLISLYNNMNNE